MSKALITSQLSYEGKARLKILHNDKIIKIIEQHNTATQVFLDLIMEAIAGMDIRSNIPKYMTIYDIYDDKEKHVILNYFIPFSSNKFDGKNNVARFTAYIPSKAFINGDNDKNYTLKNIGIYNNPSTDSESNLANIDLRNNTYPEITVSKGTSIIFEWEVSIKDPNMEEVGSSNEIETQPSTSTSNRTLLKVVRS